MKKLFFTLVIGATLMSCQTSDKKTNDAGNIDSASARIEDSIRQKKAEEMLKIAQDSANFTTIEWIDPMNADLGKVKEGKVVEVSYRFRNTGDKPLYISHVSASCGCTVPKKPEQAILPGKEDVIKAEFDSKNRVGLATKSIYVTANTKPSGSHELTFKVEVTN
jgi:hypothetical protein